MHFRVIGHRRDNAARVTLEFEAESKAAAERDAVKQGIEVVRVEVIQGGAPPAPPPVQTPVVGQVRQYTPAPTRRGIPGFWIFLFLVIAAAAAWYFWPHIKPFLPSFAK